VLALASLKDLNSEERKDVSPLNPSKYNLGAEKLSYQTKRKITTIVI
jgi:hypothetical protein